MRATSSSCAVAVVQWVWQPTDCQKRARGSVRWVGALSSLVRRQAAPSKRDGSAAVSPFFSEPAMGWLPMKGMAWGEGEVWGAFDAADIGDEAGFGEAGEDGGGDEVRHCANGDGEDEEVCVGEGGWEVGGGVGDAEVLCFDE